MVAEYGDYGLVKEVCFLKIIADFPSARSNSITARQIMDKGVLHGVVPCRKGDTRFGEGVIITQIRKILSVGVNPCMDMVVI